MLSKLNYRLALDIGTNSIGWCLIKLKNKAESATTEPQAIIKMGVRIFSDGRNPKDGTSLAASRRAARQMRRRRDRLLKRKNRLLDKLTELGFFPSALIECKQYVQLDPYEIRAKGLDKTLSGPEFARALFHINQRRGFLSNRKTDKKDQDSSTLKQAIITLREKLKQESCRTLGEWLAKRHEQGLSIRARLHGKTKKDKSYDFYADRSMIEHEFDTLWIKQSQFNPQLFNEGSKQQLKDILLFQRPLKPVQPGRCTLLPDEERAPLALPSTQLFRIYQEVNNLKIVLPGFQEKSLDKTQRDQVISLLKNKREVTFKKIKTDKTIAPLLATAKDATFNLEDCKRTALKGNITASILAKDEHFGSNWDSFNLAQQDAIVDKLLNEPSEQELIDWLVNHCSIDRQKAANIANVILPEGYGRLSKAALDKILPKLIKEVITYDKAVTAAGFNSHSALSHAQQTGEIMDSLPYYGEPLNRYVAFSKENPKNDEERFGKIANPTVHVGLNQLQKVVNAIIERYGHPSEVILEVTRDLKLSKKKKQEIQAEQKQNQDRNQIMLSAACQAIGRNPDTLDKSERREMLQKMQLWYELNPNDETNRRCPYTGTQISINRLLSSEVEIEHILPFSRTLDDSLNNKTVCINRANRIKGNDTPYEAFGAKNESGYNYDDILQRAALMPKNKGWKFAKDGYENWLKNNKDFLARALNDTAYISTVASDYLSLICPPNHVRAIPGRMTAKLRGKFGLNQLLSGNEEKNRDDHRHHALDAAVIGITDQGLLKKFADANKRTGEFGLKRLVSNMPLPWSTYRGDVKFHLQHITVSHKPDHGYQGAMHEETAWGIKADGTATRLAKDEDSDKKIRKNEKKQLIQINSSNDPGRHKKDALGHILPYKGYVGGSNYAIEIWKDDKGKWQGDVIRTFDAYQIIKKLGEPKGIKQLRNPTLSQSGKPLVMRLMINDYVKLQIDGVRKLMRVIRISGNGQFYLAEPHEANIDARDRDKHNTFKFLSKYAGSLQKMGAAFVTISPIGKASIWKK